MIYTERMVDNKHRSEIKSAVTYQTKYYGLNTQGYFVRPIHGYCCCLR